MNDYIQIEYLLRRNKYLWFIMGVFLLGLYFLPYMILGQEAAIRIFDNLDGEVIYKMLTARDGFWLNYNAVIPEIMNGLPRFCITSGLNFTTLMYGIFPPFAAYLVNDCVMRLVGFVGMYLLMKRYVLSSEQRELQAFLIAGGYILISYFTIYGLTDLGQPLVLYSYLNVLRGRQMIIDYLCILLFPFFSSFVLSGFFVGVAFGVMGIIEMWRARKFQKTIFWTVTGYVVCCMVVEYNLIMPILTGFHSHREETIFGSEGQFLQFALRQLWETYIHPGQFYTLPIWILVVLALLNGKGQGTQRMWKTLLGFLLIYAIIISIFYLGVSIKGFRLTRFYHLLPVCWFILLGVAVSSIKRRYSVILYSILVLQIAFLFFRHVNYVSGNRVRDYIGLTSTYSYPSYESFYAKKLFQRVSDFIGREKSEYRILNVGILPAVTQYNGFYTLDSYQNNYPLAYKHQFRKVMEQELNKAPEQSGIFDHFGNWCYIFPAEVQPVTIIEGKYHKNSILHNLELSPKGLNDLGCDYVFSSAEIKNCENSGLRFLHFFVDEKAHWDVWLYEVI